MDLSPELLFHVFNFLDVPNLRACICVSTIWNELGNLSSLWKMHCTDRFPPLTESMTGDNWKQVFFKLSQLKPDGSWNLSTLIDGDSVVYDYDCNINSTEDPEVGCRVIKGTGIAPWGYFKLVGCQCGPFIAHLNIYDESNFVTCSVKHFILKENKIAGPFITTWMNRIGYSILFHPTSICQERDSIQLLLDNCGTDKSDSDLETNWKMSFSFSDGRFITDNVEFVKNSPNSYLGKVVNGERMGVGVVACWKSPVFSICFEQRGPQDIFTCVLCWSNPTGDKKANRLIGHFVQTEGSEKISGGKFMATTQKK